ncbi:hypothetical protein [Saccharospirillum sp.]|uniref:hypothetical protein n=1 Tax=Saccharospirillum sp. TaxID=2033801 RepID=UPI0034A06685
MRYWLMTVLTALASLASAEESAERWDNWDQLPEDVLELGGATSAEQLSQRLDSLIQQNPDSAEIDRLLELWLEQATTLSGGKAVPLQSLIELTIPGEPGLSGPARSERRERLQQLQQLLQGLPADGQDDSGGSQYW